MSVAPISHYRLARQVLLDALASLKDPHTPLSDKVGICSEVTSRITASQWCEQEALLLSLIDDWPEHSGSWNYPVPCPDGGCPRDAYHSSSGRRWDKGTLYGQARWRLVDYLIETLQKELTNEPVS